LWFAAVLTATAFVSHSAAAVSLPAVDLAESRVVPGMSVQVTGNGFPASDGLALTLDGRQVCGATSGSKGDFSVTLTVPPDVGQGDHVLAVADQSGVSAQVQVTVGAPDPAKLIDTTFPSTGLGGDMRLAVYLPPGYTTGTEHYPVIYFLHGLPAAQLAYRSWAPFLAKALGALGSPAIAVIPQAARDGDPDPEYLDWGEARNWETALGSELPAYIDAHYRTIPNRSGRALVGVSAGGYGAVLLGLHRLGAFSVLESWSGYFEPTDPSGLTRLDLGSPAANAAATAFTFVPTLAAAFNRQPTFLAFYVGDQDTRFNADNVRFHRKLVAASVRHTFAHYPGGHATLVWSTHAVQWLGLALAHLAHPG
jgi:enterochelin esterase-like enzyme